MVYTLTLNPALDYIIKLDNLRFDDINRSVAEEIHYGGKGINVSVVLKRLGIDTKILGFSGGFSGKKLKDLLNAEDTDFDFCELKSGETRINIKIECEKELDINADGPIIDRLDILNLESKLSCISDGDYLVISGSVPKSLPDNIYETLIKNLSSKNINLTVDTTGKQLLNILKYRPFLIKPNHIELGGLFGVSTDSEERIIEYAGKLQKLGAKNVLVSRGADGAILLDENGKVTVSKALIGKPISSVGCGDSMVAGFIAGYIKNGDYEYALKLGTACGCATAFKTGLAEKEEILSAFNML